MDKAQQQFQKIAEKLAAENKHVTIGKMMSSPGIRYKNKVFAFYYKNKMVFRFGRDFDPKSLGIKNYSLLSPFKTRPPLVDWFEIPASSMKRWEELALLAMKRMRDNSMTRS
jgi:hypothetical protein